MLLDENLRPKISGFGLAKLCKKGKERSIFLMHEALLGTSHLRYGRPSNKSDIFSFGMLILVMVGARKMENLAFSTGS